MTLTLVRPIDSDTRQGRIQGFQKGGLRPAIRNAGGGGCPLKARYEKRRGGGGGGGGCCPALQARYKKRGRGRGCLAEEGALPYTKGGGVATPNPPPPPPIPLDPPLPGQRFGADVGHN